MKPDPFLIYFSDEEGYILCLDPTELILESGIPEYVPDDIEYRDPYKRMGELTTAVFSSEEELKSYIREETPVQEIKGAKHKEDLLSSPRISRFEIFYISKKAHSSKYENS